MAANVSAESKSIQEILKPFYQRAQEAEQRLAKLEGSLSGRNNETVFAEQSDLVAELQSKLESERALHLAATEEASKEIQRLNSENAKLQYRITHLLRALNEAASKPGTC